MIQTLKEMCACISPLIMGCFLVGMAYITYYGTLALFWSELAATIVTFLVMAAVFPVALYYWLIKFDPWWRSIWIGKE